MSRRSVEWARKARQTGATTRDDLVGALWRMFPSSNVKGEGKMCLWNERKSHKERSGTPSRVVGTRPMKRDKQDRIIRSCAKLGALVALLCCLATPIQAQEVWVGTWETAEPIHRVINDQEVWIQALLTIEADKTCIFKAQMQGGTTGLIKMETISCYVILRGDHFLTTGAMQLTGIPEPGASPIYMTNPFTSEWAQNDGAWNVITSVEQGVELFRKP